METDARPGRLWSLWELMNLFDVSQVAWFLHEINKHESLPLLNKLQGNGGRKPTAADTASLKEMLDTGMALFQRRL
jgi:hypothetical protein